MLIFVEGMSLDKISLFFNVLIFVKEMLKILRAMSFPLIFINTGLGFWEYSYE